MISTTKITRSTKMCSKSYRICNSVVRKSRKPRNVVILRRYYRQRLINLYTLSSFKNHNLPQILTPPQSSDDDRSTSSLIPSEDSESPINRIKLTVTRSRFGSRRTVRKYTRIEQSVPQRFGDLLEQQQKQLQPTNTPQMPAMQHFATSNVTAAPLPNLNFTSYAAISSIQQRRHYKAQYEQSYDEYYQLLQRIEKLQCDYVLLSHQMQRVSEGSVDYEHLIERIKSEYQRINSVAVLRSQYLYSKLMHIRKLVADYDASLTSKTATARLAAAVIDYLQRQQPSFISAAGFGSMRPENANCCDTLQSPALRLTVANLRQHDKQQGQVRNHLNYLDINTFSHIVWNVASESRIDVIDIESTDTASIYSESKDKDTIYSESIDEDSIYSESTDILAGDSSYSESSHRYSSYNEYIYSIYSESTDRDSCYSE